MEGTEHPGTTGRLRPSSDSRGAVQIGLLVRSTQGRDSGRYYLVVGVESDTKVRVADGELRKVETPKRKNIRHLKSCGLIAGEVRDKALDAKRVTNNDVRKELKSLVEKLESEILPIKEVGLIPDG
ncbi:MAG: hypothetical protein BWY80_00885 [Firmicutes bacterium ADurb.Bin456]|nr:MAG: hypothetical protein BWY80_00885 [Firmicutes bacterium ADurb.Bin456]